MAPARCALVANDSHLVRWALARALQTEGFEVHNAGSRDELRQEINTGRFDLIVTPARIERQSVLDLLARVDPNRPPLFIVACGEDEARTVVALCPHAEIIDEPMSITAVVGLAARRVPRTTVSPS